jgi:hypothetical protein
MSIDQTRHARDDLARGAGNALSSALEWGGTSSILIGDHIETQSNASCLQATAAMLGRDFGSLAVQDAARTDAIVQPDSACLVNPAGAGAQPAADHRDRECDRSFVLAPIAAEHAELQARLDAVFRDAVAAALRGGRRTTFYLIAVPDGRPHSKETP